MQKFEFEVEATDAHEVMRKVEERYPLRCSTSVKRVLNVPDLFAVEVEVYDDAEESKRIHIATTEDIKRIAKSQAAPEVCPYY